MQFKFAKLQTSKHPAILSKKKIFFSINFIFINSPNEMNYSYLLLQYNF